MRRNIEYVFIPEQKLPRLESFIRGSLIGDGSIPTGEKRSINLRLSFGHSVAQLPYLKWKHKILSSYNLAGAIRSYTSISERYKSGSCTSYFFRSYTHPIFTKYRDLYYYEGEKCFSRTEDIYKLDEFALAIWYMDDANLWNRKGRSTACVLNTQGYSKKDIDLLISIIEGKWGIKASRIWDNTIRCTVQSSKALVEIVSPFMVECMKYKTVLLKPGEFGGKPEMVNTEPSIIELSLL